MKVNEDRKPIFAQSCRLAQPGDPTAPREVHLPLLPHGPSGVHRRLPRRTRLRQATGPEENRSAPLESLHLTRTLKTGRSSGYHQLSRMDHHHFTPTQEICQERYLPISRLYLSLTSAGILPRSVKIAVARAWGHSQVLALRSAGTF